MEPVAAPSGLGRAGQALLQPFMLPAAAPFLGLVNPMQMLVLACPLQPAYVYDPPIETVVFSWGVNEDGQVWRRAWLKAGMCSKPDGQPDGLPGLCCKLIYFSPAIHVSSIVASQCSWGWTACPGALLPTTCCSPRWWRRAWVRQPAAAAGCMSARVLSVQLQVPQAACSPYKLL